MTAAKSFIEITKSRPIQRDEMIQSLLDLGYERSSMVIEQGTDSVKGSVVEYFQSIKINPFDVISLAMALID